MAYQYMSKMFHGPCKNPLPPPPPIPPTPTNFMYGALVADVKLK